MFLEMLKKLHRCSRFAFCSFFNPVVIKLMGHLYTSTAVKCDKPDLTLKTNTLPFYRCANTFLGGRRYTQLTGNFGFMVAVDQECIKSLQ